MEEFHTAAGPAQDVDVGRLQVPARGADRVDEDPDGDAVRGPLRERVAEARADVARPEDVRLEVHGPAGGGDRGEHRGEDRVAVFEEVEPVRRTS